MSAIAALDSIAEAERIKSLRSYLILDSLPDPDFDNIAWLAARFCDAPMVVIALVDTDRVWFKAKVGTVSEMVPRVGSFCDATISQTDIAEVPDASFDARFTTNPLVPEIARFYAGAPLLMPDGCAIGTLCVLDRTPRQLTSEQRAGLAALARQVVTLLSYRLQGVRDPLTGLFNRRYLIDAPARELHRADRRDEPASLLLLDVDHFKRINDDYGHGAGDAVLRQLGEVLNNNTRGEDIVARYGGEEFIVVLPGTHAAEAGVCAENLRQITRQLPLAHEGRILPRLTVSIGISAYPTDASDGASLIRAADGALYAAKRSGRDRVCFSHGQNQDLFSEARAG